MTIIRAPRPTQGYTVVSNTTLRDQRLSWKARGLLIYLLSLPDNWATNSTHLARMAPDGRASVLSGLKELEQAGYLRRGRKQNAAGQWSTITTIYDTPHLWETLWTNSEPDSDNPTTENQPPKESTEDEITNGLGLRLSQAVPPGMCTVCEGVGWYVDSTPNQQPYRCTVCGGDGIAKGQQ